VLSRALLRPFMVPGFVLTLPFEQVRR
jgi:hypothetical protein